MVKQRSLQAVEKTSDTMRNKSLTFYKHLTRMNESRKTKEIFNHTTKIKTATKLIEETKKHVMGVRIDPTEIWN